MRRLLTITIAAVLLLAGFAAPVAAEKWDHGCRTQATATTATTENLGSHNISNGDLACFTFVDTAGTDDAITENSPLFLVTATSAQVCYDSDIGATAPTAAAIDIRVCPHGALPSANPTFQCQPSTALLEATCLGIEPGAYYLDISAVAPGSLATSRVTIRGLGGLGD